MKLLITDAYSPLGAAISAEFETLNCTLIQPQRDEVDWCDKEAVLAYLQAQSPAMVINTLGWAEREGDDVLVAPVEAARNLALACKQANIVPLHLSSYSVFGGEQRSGYDERDERSPLSEEGEAFAAAEQHFQQMLNHWLCLRVSWLIGAEGDNLLTRLLAGLTAGERVPVCAEMRGAPTAVADVARVVVALVRQVMCGADNWGYFHYCSGDACSQADFAQQVAAILEQEKLLQGELVVAETLRPETEPASAVLNCRRCRDGFGVQLRSWRQGLHSSIKTWLRHHR